MKYLTIQLNENAKINIYNDFTGKETIFYNDKMVSSFRSFFGGRHTFEIEEDGQKVRYRIRISMNIWAGISIEIRRNGNLIFSNKPTFERALS